MTLLSQKFFQMDFTIFLTVFISWAVGSALFCPSLLSVGRSPVTHVQQMHSLLPLLLSSLIFLGKFLYSLRILALGSQFSTLLSSIYCEDCQHSLLSYPIIAMGSWIHLSFFLFFTFPVQPYRNTHPATHMDPVSPCTIQYNSHQSHMVQTEHLKELVL